MIQLIPLTVLKSTYQKSGTYTDSLLMQDSNQDIAIDYSKYWFNVIGFVMQYWFHFEMLN